MNREYRITYCVVRAKLHYGRLYIVSLLQLKVVRQSRWGLNGNQSNYCVYEAGKNAPAQQAPRDHQNIHNKTSFPRTGNKATSKNDNTLGSASVSVPLACLSHPGRFLQGPDENSGLSGLSGGMGVPYTCPCVASSSCTRKDGSSLLSIIACHGGKKNNHCIVFRHYCTEEQTKSNKPDAIKLNYSTQ